MTPVLAPAVETQRRLEGLREALRTDVRAMREVQVRVGRTLLEIRRSGDPIPLGVTTFPMFCESEGLSPTEARELTAMAEAAEAVPEVEARVVEARITPQKAAVVNEIMKQPALQRPGEDLLGLAESKCAGDLVREVKRRREEERLPGPPVTLTIFVSGRGRDDFRRCQTLVTRSLNRWASEGETLERISDEYLQRHDPEKKALRMEKRDKAKAAQVSDTVRTRPRSPQPEAEAARTNGVRHRRCRSRHVPASESRDLQRAAGDRCWVEGCTNEAHLQWAHRSPFRRNGSNRAINLVRVCLPHHRQFDSGTWRPVLRRDGVVVLIDRRGVPVGRLRDEAARFVAANGRAPP
jgi:hypothetical protein